MAASFYNNFLNNIMGAGVHARIDLDSGGVRATLYDTGGRAFTIADQDVSDITTAIADASWRTDALAGLDVGTAGVGAFDHTDEVMSAVSGATSVEAVVYFDNTPATDADRPLISFHDDWTGLPFTPNGGQVTLAPNASGVFAFNAS